jgi:signal transduction histidine kinase
MEDVRATVAVLRSGGDQAGTTPTPRISDIDELVDTARDQGLEVELGLALSGRPLPETVELTAFRVVQEAITNVVRHARARSARVTIHDSGSVLVVEVRDDGARPPGSGHRRLRLARHGRARGIDRR